MPQKAFFNLPLSKKQRIIDASYDVFLEKEYEKVAILDITTRANIPVGSFYQYFKNKDDLYLYLLRELESRILSSLYNNEEKDLLGWNEYIIGKHLTEKEKAFENTWYRVPESVVQKFYFEKENLKFFEEFYKNKFNEICRKNFLKENISKDFAMYLFITSTFNIYMYCRYRNITDPKKIEEVKKLFVTEVLPYGIFKSNNS